MSETQQQSEEFGAEYEHAPSSAEDALKILAMAADANRTPDYRQVNLTLTWEGGSWSVDGENLVFSLQEMIRSR